MNHKDKVDRAILKDNLRKLNKRQLKQFYGILVHAWASRKAFISNQNFHNLWCELNYNCAITDDSFPSPYDDYELLRSFCRAHPYYFIDVLNPELIITLFCDYLDDRLDVLAGIAKKLGTEGLRAAFVSSKAELGLTEEIDDLVTQTDIHIKVFTRNM